MSNTIEKIRAEIERREKMIKGVNTGVKGGDQFIYGQLSALKGLLSFLDTLEAEEKSEIPTNLDLEKEIESAGKEVDLEKAALNFGEEIGVPISNTFMPIASHFFKLGNQSLLKLNH